MKILYIHNNYASDNSGEEHAAEGLVNLLKRNGHTVEWYRRSSAELNGSHLRKGMAFFTGLWNPKAMKDVRNKIREFKPDLVQVQNVYPLISPGIFRTIKNEGVPLVMRCPNYRLFCPNGLHMDSQGNVCEKCLSPGREIHSIIKNCESSYSKSIGYALRNFIARKFWRIQQKADIYIVQTDFQKRKFIENGIPEKKIAILPGLTPETKTSEILDTINQVAFVGRVSLEKGIHEFIQAARLLPKIDFIVAGSVAKDLELLRLDSPPNLKWVGFLAGLDLEQVFKKSKIIVIPGKCYEGFPNVITQAMKYSKPVITSNLGAMASIIDHEKNGLLVAPGDAEELAEAISNLISNPILSKKYGEEGRKKAERDYSSQQVYKRILNIYENVISHNVKP